MSKYLLHSYMVLILSVAFLNLGCPKERITPEENPLQLTIEDVSCTEAFLKLSLATSEQNRTVTLKRNDSLIATITMSNSDSLFVDEGLLPKQTYTYTLLQNNFTVSAQATTMDTTSSNFTWETTTFGGNNGSCILNDVAIVNDTLAYAVGSIWIADSTKQNEIRYNIIKWDGKKWNLISLNYNGFPPEIKSISIVDKNDIWFDPWFHWNGQNFEQKIIDPVLMGVSINKMWNNLNELYVVGNNGFIAKRSPNGIWQKLESGTTTRINDIYGFFSSMTGKNEIYCTVTDFFERGDQKILRITNATSIDSIPWVSGRDAVSAWTYNGNTVYVCGDGVFKRTNGEWKEITDTPSFYTNHIRGNSVNDIIVCGSFCFLAHFNGRKWNWYPELYSSNGIYGSVAILNNLVIAVGLNGAKAVITTGKRN